MQQPHETNITEYKRGNFTVRIRPTIKDGKQYFIADFTVLGKRKLVWRSSLAKARQAASEAVDKMDAGQSEVLLLNSSDRHAYLRACEALRSIESIESIDSACGHYAEAIALLDGRTSLQDACRFWLKHHSVDLPTQTVAQAVEELKERDRGNVKDVRIHQLDVLLGRFAADFNVNVADIMPAKLDAWLASLTKIKGGPMSERSKRNYRDSVGYLNRFCIAKGYLPKGTDWLENARNYSATKHGAIEIFTPEEFSKILEKADERMIPFLVIGAFAGVRHEEIAKLNWEDIELEDESHSLIVIYADVAKTKVGRHVPVKPTLRKWLLAYRKDSGPICDLPGNSINNKLVVTAQKAGLKWKKNGLRKSYISYRKSESADIARVADEAGNSREVIKHNYLKVIKATEAARWFGITPASIWPDNVKGLPTAEVAA
jgi:hypothetical protein